MQVREERKSEEGVPMKDRLRALWAELLLDIAQESLLTKGYRNTSMDEIAARAGVAKGTLYQHFPSKDDLIFAVLERHLGFSEQLIEQASEAVGGSRAKLEYILDAVYLQREGLDPRLFQLLQQDQDLRAILFEKRKQLGERTGQIVRHLHALLEEGKAEAAFDPTISTELMLMLVMNLISFSRRPPLPSPGLEPRSPEALLAQAKRVLFGGIAAHLKDGQREK